MRRVRRHLAELGFLRRELMLGLLLGLFASGIGLLATGRRVAGVVFILVALAGFGVIRGLLSSDGVEMEAQDV